MKTSSRSIIRRISIIMLIVSPLIILSGCNEKESSENTFGVAFITDIHLQPELNAVEGLSQAIDMINMLRPDFILTGGDMIMDALSTSYGRADSLYKLYQETIKKAQCPVYNTMGNHEIYGIYERSGADPDNPEFGEKMFEERLGKSYYSFTHKGWKFFIINSIEDTGNNGYVGLVDPDQIEWLKNELKETDSSTPLVISTHIPFITAYSQKYIGSTSANSSTLVVENSKEIIDLFENHNLKLVLQGHLHTVEDIYIDNIHFITGGAISAGWWNGPNRGFEEGFVFLEFSDNDFSWRYVDYGWVVK